jgi:hypothetical protein
LISGSSRVTLWGEGIFHLLMNRISDSNIHLWSYFAVTEFLLVQLTIIHS